MNEALHRMYCTVLACAQRWFPDWQQTLCCQQRRVRAWGRAADQLVLTSPVAKKRSIDRPITTESTESITDWANRTGVIGFLPILNTDHVKKTTSRWGQNFFVVLSQRCKLSLLFFFWLKTGLSKKWFDDLRGILSLPSSVNFSSLPKFASSWWDDC